MEKINYYFIEEHNKEYNSTHLVGKEGHWLDNNCNWWDIKEYGFLDIAKAKALATRYNKTRDWADYSVKELAITFDTLEQKKEFISRYISTAFLSKKEYKIIMEE